jgi:catechol 2,3-dioxygenase-like lactoylglutathione lyase family enzyme
MTGTLHHIELYVSDLPRSREFWEWLLAGLGYAKYQEWLDRASGKTAGVSWKLGPTYLVLVQTQARHRASAVPPYHRCRPGLNHLAFHVETPAAVDRWTRALRERGAPILYADRHPHAGGPDSYAVFTEDPDRIKVELVAAAPPHAAP